jgi:hypothetical protein
LFPESNFVNESNYGSNLVSEIVERLDCELTCETVKWNKNKRFGVGIGSTPLLANSGKASTCHFKKDKERWKGAVIIAGLTREGLEGGGMEISLSSVVFLFHNP